MRKNFYKPQQWLPALFFALAICAVILFGFAPRGSKVKNFKPAPPFSIPAKSAGQGYIYFAGIGDQGEGTPAQRKVAELLNAKAQSDSLHFMLLLGDNFYSDGVASVTDPQWRTKFEDIYNLPHLNVPFYAALGNHDHHKGRGHFQVEYTPRSKKWKMPTPYYTFTQKIDAAHHAQFIALDTETIAADAQLEWLERELKNSQATWKIVFGHHPVFSYGDHGNTPAMITHVRPLLEKYNVDAYVCGHDHDRQLLEPVNGVHYIISGTGAKSRSTAYGEHSIFTATNLGFAWFRVSAKEFHVQFIDGSGKIEYAHTWLKGSVAKRTYEEMMPVGKGGKGSKRDSKEKKDKKSWWW
ncbi:MAG: metallophosphoesterase [candidate division KSB1 bacterium]